MSAVVQLANWPRETGDDLSAGAAGERVQCGSVVGGGRGGGGLRP